MYWKDIQLYSLEAGGALSCSCAHKQNQGALKNEETLHLINLDSIRDIMDAESVIGAILYVDDRKFKGVINIGCGRRMSVRQIAELLVERLSRHLLITGENKAEPNSLVADITELQKIIESVIC